MVEDYSHKSDFELVELTKSGAVSKSVLYERYKYMLVKNGAAMRHKLREDSDFLADYLQEGFFIIDKAIAYVDKQKISTPDSWCFGTTLWYFIRNHNAELMRKKRRADKHHGPFRVCLDDMAEVIPCVEQEKCDPLELKSWVDGLTSRQLAIVKLRAQGKGLMEIKEILETSYGTVHREYQIARKSLKSRTSLTI